MTFIPPLTERVVAQAALFLMAIMFVAGCGKSNPSPAVASDPKQAKTNAVPSKTNSTPVALTNVVDASLELRSLFDDKLKGGRDPFFPQSMRPRFGAQTNAAPIVQRPIELALKGVTGRPGRYYALINGTVLMENQERNVLVSGNRTVRITCVKITENTATVRVEGSLQPLELRFTEKH